MAPSLAHQRRVANKIATILAAMTSQPETAAQLAERLNMTTKDVSPVLSALANRMTIEKCGTVRVKHTNRTTCLVPLWRLNADGEARQKLPPRTPVKPDKNLRAPMLEYRGEFSALLGEPPIGRSALDQRRSAQ